MGLLPPIGSLPPTMVKPVAVPSQVPVTSVSTSRSLTQSRCAQAALTSTSRPITSHLVRCMSLLLRGRVSTGLAVLAERERVRSHAGSGENRVDSCHYWRKDDLRSYSTSRHRQPPVQL